MKTEYYCVASINNHNWSYVLANKKNNNPKAQQKDKKNFLESRVAYLLLCSTLSFETFFFKYKNQISSIIYIL